MTKASKILREDFGEIIDQSEHFVGSFAGARHLIFGGSGFVGKWLVSVLEEVATSKGGKPNITVVSRDPQQTELAVRRFKQNTKGSPTNFISYSKYFSRCDSSQYVGGFDFIFHLATPTTHFDESLKLITPTAHRIVETIENHANVPKLTHFSSGIVYNYDSKLPTKIQEDCPVVEEMSTINVYQKTKLELENIFNNASARGVLEAINPRLFAFLGPGFPINGHFAASSFVRDAMAGRRITIQGNTMNSRSYMYPTDLMLWTLRALSKFREILEVPLNFGSSDSITIGQLATLVASSSNQVEVICEDGSSTLEHHYVPSVESTSRVLGVQLKKSVSESVIRWISYLQGN